MRVNLLFGFLGSGKTTLVRRLLAQHGRDMKTAVIVNEFGEVGVDGDILRGNSVDIVELNSGCLCCTLKGSLLLAVEELRTKANVERVIVEATGIAQPGDLTGTLRDSSLHLDLDIGPLVTVVDAAKFPKLVAVLGEFYVDQIENADILVLNKADLVTPEVLEDVGRQLREINPTADILYAEQCDVDAEYLLDRGASGVVARAALAPGGAHHGNETHPHDHGDHGAAPAESFVLAAGGNPDRNRVEAFFRGLPDAVWRAKGFMTVGGQACLIQFAMGQLEITPAAAPSRERIVFIGRGMDRTAIATGFAMAKPN